MECKSEQGYVKGHHLEGGGPEEEDAEMASSERTSWVQAWLGY